jgi:putative membrane-bound dehydrogenase-like protein
MRILLPFLCCVLTSFAAGSGNRLTVVDEFCDIYYPNAVYPKLTTPQWIGEEGVDAALILAIDDMRDPPKYEAYLRPILNRLKEIDGRAALSIMTCKVEPNDPQLQSWLREGLSLEVHTIDHPCPILDKSDFSFAKSTYDRCIDLMASIPGNNPVAFRTPCMDGINSASPRLFAEVMMRTAPSGRFLTISSSIGMILTPADPENSKELVTDSESKPRFQKYAPPGWVNYIKDYPYPWTIGNSFWEAGFCLPDDYQGSKPHGDKSQKTVDDMKASIDAVVAKKGLWVMTFHPYNWIGSNQVVELVDHTVSKHGKHIKFLNFREAQERIDKNLLGGQPLRRKDGGDNGVRLLDLNDDGYLDVVIGNDALTQTRLWNPKTSKWQDGDFPVQIGPGTRFGILQNRGLPSLIALTEKRTGLWHFDGGRWTETGGTAGLELDGEKILAERNGRDNGVRLRDLDGDGVCELIVSNPRQNAIFNWNEGTRTWSRAAYSLPTGVSIVTDDGRDNGVRFVDFNKDGAADLIASNEKEYGLWLYVPGDFLGFKKGFSRQIIHAKRGDKPEIPMIVRGGEFPNNSAWFTSDSMLLENEDTAKLPDLLERVSFKELLDGLHPQAKSPQESRAAIEPLPGFQVDLVAHEPQVESPVYLDWSADGSLWVVEMRDYPRGINGKPAGVIKHLQDEDGDGVYEKSTVFLENLNYPNGLFPWRKGLLISAAPDIIYAEDTDGDGRADKTEVLFTGFVEGNQQHRANGYEWGLDGWLYGANGDSGGEILSKKTGKRVSISGRDFRFKPDTGEFEAISGNAQYGRHRDDWGNWFGGANYTWGWHYFLEEQYLSRNPTLAVRGTYKQYATGPDAGRVYPISRVQQRFNDIGMAGHVTSACSFSPYRDTLFGPGFENAIFISEPVHNLVHREILEPDNLTFTSHRAPEEENREFLASRDPWFRPTTVKTGPDGALYICDMYRLVIEHPEWIPDDVQKRMNLRAGEGMGRIYRVRPKDKILRKIPNLASLKDHALLTALESPNGWTRDTAQRLLIERNATNRLPELEDMLEAQHHPKVHLQALATLATLNGLTPRLLLTELENRNPLIRAAAIRLSGPFLFPDEPAYYDLATTILQKRNEPDLRVRYQLALSLGAVGNQWSIIAAESLAKLAAVDRTNDTMITAILSSSAKHPELVLKNVLQKKIESERLISGLLKTAVRLGKADPGPGKADALSAVAADLLNDSEMPAWKLQAIASLLNANAEIQTTLLKNPNWNRAATGARQLAASDDADSNARAAAVQLLARSNQNLNEDIAVMARLLAHGNSATLQRAALARLEQIDSPSVPENLLKAWSGADSSTRNSILATLIKRDQGANALLSAIENRRLSTADLGATIRQELLSARSESLRERAKKILTPTDTARDNLVREYVEAVHPLKGDSEQGRALFTTHCALCHKAGNVGTGAGPNLAMLYDRGPEQIITAILDPNRAVEDRYRNYLAELKNDEELSGLLVSETGNSVTIIGINGIEQTILRSDLRSLTAQPRSLMPEGFEQFLKPQDLAHLISFIQNSAAKPKPFPGNHPELVRSDANGILHLTAANAEIYGDTLIYESGHQNLGYWKTESDHAVWTLQSTASITYDVWLDWACPNDRQNNQYLFQTAGQTCLGSVDGTGTWDDYRQKKIGEITLPSGTHRATFRAAKTVKGFLLDLHELRLIPHQTQSAKK